jgi:hypothetical protein
LHAARIRGAPTGKKSVDESRAILLLPFIVTVVIPGVILWLTGPDTLGLWQSAPAASLWL